jgi:branched-chain amino acid transport system ATP-binding protein
VTADALVRLDRVTKRFGGLHVIDELSIALGRGEALGVVGPNGAGKTTMLNLVAGELRPSGGTVWVDGADVTKTPAHVRCRLGVARTAQIPRPFEGLTVFENALVGATAGAGLRGQAAIDAAVEALERATLVDKANVRAGTLTLLQRKRLELARALACGPRVLLLDEIAGGLTEAEIHQLVATIETLHGEGLSLIWIEHIVHALLRVVDRMVAMDYGRVLIEGDPHDVMASDEVQAVYLGVT